MKIERVLFIGSKSLGLECLKTLWEIKPEVLQGIVTINDENDTRSVKKEIQEFAREKGLPFYCGNSNKMLEKAIKETSPHLVIVVGWYTIIPPHILYKVKAGFIGLHNSLLPKYRGGSPLIWAIINGEKKVGISLFYITEEMDAGDILGQKSIMVEKGDYISDILSKLKEKAVELMHEVYPLLLEGKAPRIPQDHTQATYCAQRYPFDGEINWQWSNSKIYNFIRAQSDPYPGAFTFWQERKLYVWKALPLEVTIYGTPGQIAWVKEDGVYVVCGNNKPLILQEVQWEGGLKAPANRILNSIKIRLGK